jgi:hypothetical protein
MAFPQGISQAAMRLKRENGTADTWLAEHRKQKEAGTLDSWLATQDDLGVVASVNKPSEARPVRKSRNQLDAAMMACGALGSLLKLASFDSLEADHIEAMQVLMGELRLVSEACGDAVDSLLRAVAKLQREADLLAENEAKANRIAELEAQLAQAEEKLRVTGNSEPLPSRANKKLMLKTVEA